MKHYFTILFLCAFAFKGQANRLYISQNGAGTFDGTSWSNAVNGSGAGLALVLNASGPNDTIWVATGIYYTNSAVTPNVASTLTSFLILGAKVYGGFAGSETDISQRNVEVNPSILSGNVGQDLDQTNNARHVVRMSGDHPVLDGFIVEGGYADGGVFVGNSTYQYENIPLHGTGGGLLIYGTAPIIADTVALNFSLSINTLLEVKVRNCIFRNNYASGYSTGGCGGAAASVLAAWKTTVNAQFENCQFKSNVSEYNGGAMYASSTKSFPIIYRYNNNTYTNTESDSTHGNLTLQIENCLFDSNSSPTNNAGALYLNAAASSNNLKPKMKTFINASTFTHNKAGTNGALVIEMSTGNRTGGFDSLAITNSMFSNNYAIFSSGNASVISTIGNDDTSGVFNFFMYNSTFSNNENHAWGNKGVFVSNMPGVIKAAIRKCSFTGNKTVFGAACINFDVGNPTPYPQFYKSSVIIDSCIFRNNRDSSWANGIGVMDLFFRNPTDTFVISNSTISNNKGQLAQVYIRNSGAIKITNCSIDSNNTDAGNSIAPLVISGKTTYSEIKQTRVLNNNEQSTPTSYGAGGVYYFGPGVFGDTVVHKVQQSIFKLNKGFYGGACQISGSTGVVKMEFKNSVFSGNTAVSNGGAIASMASAQRRTLLLFENCLVSGNRSESTGGGIYNEDAGGNIRMFQTTVSGNYVSQTGTDGAGVYTNPSSSNDTSLIVNSIIWDNVCNGNTHAEVVSAGSSQHKIKVVNSIVKNGFNSSLFPNDSRFIVNDVWTFPPLFAAPFSPTSSPIASGDYALQFCSPAVNRSILSGVVGDLDVDLTNRVKQGVADLGAFESNYDNGLTIPIAYSNYIPVCEFQSFQLFAVQVDSASSLLWSGPEGFSSNLINPIVSAPNHSGIADSSVVYTLLANYANGCSLSDTVGVYVRSGPFVNILSSDSTMCGTPLITTLYSLFTPGVTTPNFYWYENSPLSAVIGTTQNIVINTDSSSKYFLKGVDPSTTCTSTDSVSFTLLNKPITSPITGNLTVDTNATEVYSVLNTLGSLYHWTILGGLQTSGGATNNIGVTWGNNITSGMVKVVETNMDGCLGDTVFSSLVSILPVSWLRIDASKEGVHTVINWQTASEINNRGYDIERSLDGTTFNKIGWVKGNGTTQILSTYQYTDYNSSKLATQTSTLFYRLKQMDFDGQFQYSKVVSVSLSASAKQSLLTLFPNPTLGNLLIRGLTERAIIRDVVGNELLSVEKDGTFDFSIYPAGIYFIHSGSVIQKIVKY